MMNRSFARAHVFAWMAAVIFAVPAAVALTLVPPRFVLHNPDSCVPVLIISSVGLVLAWALAKFLRAYDFFLVLAGVLAVALAFAISYSMDVHIFLPDDGHTFFDVLTWGARPFDLVGQGTILSGLALWCGGIIAVAVAMKRFWEKQDEGLDAIAVDHSRLLRWLAIDVLLVIGTTAAWLGVELQNRIAQGKPDFLIGQLQAPATALPDRLQDIWELSNFTTPEATAALREAATQQEPPVNLTAALTLLEQNDISKLPIVEDAVLRHPAVLKVPWSPSELETFFENITAPEAIPALTRMMASHRADVRRGVARALSHIRSSDVIVPLVQGLDDSDQEVRYHSVCGLITVVGDGRYPAEGKFLANEDYYLKFWRDWAKARVTAKI